MPDNGLLGGLGAGLQSFADTYLRAKQINQQEQNDKTRFGLQEAEQKRATEHQQFEEQFQSTDQETKNLERGLLRDSDNPGHWKKGPGLLSKEQADMESRGYEPDTDHSGQYKKTSGLLEQERIQKALADPNSVESQGIYSHIKTLAGKYGDVVPQGLSGLAYQKMYGDAAKLAGTQITANANMARGQAIGGAMQQRVEVQKDTQTAHAGDIFDKNPVLQQYGKQRDAVQRGFHTLTNPPIDPASGKQVITNQLFNEVANDFASALSGARAAAVSTQDKQEMNSMAQRFAEMKQKLTGNPQDAVPQEFVSYMKQSLQRLDQAYAQNSLRKAQEIRQGRAYKFNPEANKAMDEKLTQYQTSSRGLLGEQPQATTQPTPHPQDNAAVDWAKQNPKDPRAAQILKLNGVQ